MTGLFLMVLSPVPCFVFGVPVGGGFVVCLGLVWACFNGLGREPGVSRGSGKCTVRARYAQ